MANAAIAGNFILVIVVGVLLPLLTQYVSGTPNGMMTVAIRQYMRGVPRSAYYEMQEIIADGTSISVPLIFGLNVIPFLVINVASLYRRNDESTTHV